MVACAAPPSGGRHTLSKSFTRHFHILNIPTISEFAMLNLFKCIVDGYYARFKPDVQVL